MTDVDTDNLPPVFADYDEDVRRLGGLCRELQRRNGNEPFFLACRTAAKLLGLPTHTEVAKWLKMLAADGVLAVAQRGTTRKAARYRWIGNEVDSNAV